MISTTFSSLISTLIFYFASVYVRKGFGKDKLIQLSFCFIFLAQNWFLVNDNACFGMIVLPVSPQLDRVCGAILALVTLALDIQMISEKVAAVVASVADPLLALVAGIETVLIDVRDCHKKSTFAITWPPSILFSMCTKLVSVEVALDVEVSVAFVAIEVQYVRFGNPHICRSFLGSGFCFVVKNFPLLLRIIINDPSQFSFIILLSRLVWTGEALDAQVLGERHVRRGVRSYAQCGCNVLAKF